MENIVRLPLLDKIRGPVFFTGAFITQLQQHFSLPETLFDESLKRIIWSPTNEGDQTTATKVYIDNKLQPKPNQANFRPAILIHRGEWKRTPLARNDVYGMGASTSSPKMDMWNAKHTFTCLARQYPTVESLAREVSLFFEMYAVTLAELLCLNEIRVEGLSAPQLVDKEDDVTFFVDVEISYSFLHSWSLENVRMPIRHVFLDINVDNLAYNILK
jgi:hypothetical protein